MDKHCFIILYELKTPMRDYTALYNAIKSYEHWGKITSTSWAIVSDLSYVEIRDNLSKFLGKDDRLMVVQSGHHAAWANAMAPNDWLKQNLIK